MEVELSEPWAAGGTIFTFDTSGRGSWRRFWLVLLTCGTCKRRFCLKQLLMTFTRSNAVRFLANLRQEIKTSGFYYLDFGNSTTASQADKHTWTRYFNSPGVIRLSKCVCGCERAAAFKLKDNRDSNRRQFKSLWLLVRIVYQAKHLIP